MPRKAVRLLAGLALPDGERVADAEVRALCGRDEEWLVAHPPDVPTSIVATDLVARTTVRLGDHRRPSRQDVLRLAVADRDYLLLALRAATRGSRFDVVVGCPSCESAMDVSFSAGDLPVARRPPVGEPLEVVVRRGDGTEARVAFRVPTCADQEAAAEGHKPWLALLSRCVEGVDGGDGGPEGMRRLDEPAVADLEEAVEEACPKVELAMDLTCPECDHSFGADFDLAQYLLDEMRRSSQQVLYDLHVLASQYHWSERGIMALPRAKRRALVEFVADERRLAGGG